MLSQPGEGKVTPMQSDSSELVTQSYGARCPMMMGCVPKHRALSLCEHWRRSLAVFLNYSGPLPLNGQERGGSVLLIPVCISGLQAAFDFWLDVF